KMTEHDEHGIRSIFSVLSGSLPVFIGEFLETRNETPSIGDELGERCFEIHLHQEIVGILFARQIRTNHGRRLAQHLIQPLKEKRMHMCEMTCMLVSRPAVRLKA